ncbi:hypothetical protein SAMN05428952_100950 [Nitrosomonas sp. Nm132]|nr:hypothetical protein SAMN05428952_100950 [Nitrosomonas sp. Nm132]
MKIVDTKLAPTESRRVSEDWMWRLKSSTRIKLNAHESTHLKSRQLSEDGGFYQIYKNKMIQPLKPMNTRNSNVKK